MTVRHKNLILARGYKSIDRNFLAIRRKAVMHVAISPNGMHDYIIVLFAGENVRKPVPEKDHV
jgi:hypothetical protein